MESYAGILWTIFVIIIAIICIGDKKYGKPTRTQPPETQNRAQNRTQSRPVPPPEIVQRRSVPSVPEVEITDRKLSIYDYPKCPICRSRNLRGEAQTVFSAGGGFKCHRGHTF